jgi:hypothetical protein
MPMQNDDLDRSLLPLVHALRELPESDSRAVKHVLARVRLDDGRPTARRRALRRYFAARSGWWAAAAVLVVGVGVTLYARSSEAPSPGAEALVVRADDLGDPAPVLPPSREPGEDAMITDRLVARQFFIDYRQARQVALVGDFNQWNPREHRLQRDGAGARWSIVVSLPAGLHKYAFIVDDSVWTPDPGAVRTVDRDFGVTSSLVLVQ